MQDFPDSTSPPPRLGCLYSAALDPFLKDVVRDIGDGVLGEGGEWFPLAIETLSARASSGLPKLDALYVLPFDLPGAVGSAGEAEDVEAYVARMFPGAKVVTPFAVQDLCRDKIATQERLLKHGVATPAALVTGDFREVKSFVREERFAMLKDPISVASSGLFVVWIEEGELVGDCGSHQVRIRQGKADRIELDGETLHYPAPFYLQRLIVQHGRGMPAPGQLLRAYVVDRDVKFWTERFRDSYRRPSDWIISAARGARYRFLHDVRHEAEKLALRAADVLGISAGVIDLVRTQGAGPYVIDVAVDGRHMVVDRGFKRIPEFRGFFDFDRYVGAALVRQLRQPEAPPPPPDPPQRQRRGDGPSRGRRPEGPQRPRRADGSQNERRSFARDRRDPRKRF